MSRSTATVCLLVFCVAFLITARLISPHLPPTKSALTATLANFAKQKDEVDLLFIGPSLVYCHLDPEVFDEVAAQSGLPIRSYNLGLPAMSVLEMYYALQRVREMQPERLKWVVLTTDVDLKLAKEQVLTDRIVSWHDDEIMALAAALVWESEDDLRRRCKTLWRHLRAYCYETWNFGKLARLHQTVMRQTPRAPRISPPNRHEGGDLPRGYASIEQVMESGPAAQRRLMEADAESWQAMGSEYEGLVWEARRQREHPTIRNDEAEIVRWLQDVIESVGAQALFFLPPTLDDELNFLWAGFESGIVHDLLDFGDPGKHPDLFAAELRFDRYHLNRDGSCQLTERLARQFVARSSELGVE